ncbi:MAG: hypothetical protein CMO81_03240 [Waddliaceae bacterium]|nr:hypothetical protein [Waddliaceae bacterium]
MQTFLCSVCGWLKKVSGQALSTGVGALLGAYLIYLAGLSITPTFSPKEIKQAQAIAKQAVDDWQKENEDISTQVQVGEQRMSFQEASDKGVIGRHNVTLQKLDLKSKQTLETYFIPQVQPSGYRLSIDPANSQEY